MVESRVHEDWYLSCGERMLLSDACLLFSRIGICARARYALRLGVTIIALRLA